ncbi:MAG TPA: HAMP domain-containing sensor histidine kinase [Acidimicrobiia bacterium]|nr:HAMP domain-containing sensor histidine kinase [Acidimicrobiia bacterium]
MSLRLRVALFTAAGASVLLVVGSLAVLAAVRSDQIASVDTLLTGQYQVLAQPAATAARLNRPRLEKLAFELLLAPPVIRVWEGDELLLEQGAEDLAELPAAGAGYSTLQGGGARYRVFSDTVEARLALGSSVDVEVAISLVDMDDIYDRLRSRLRRLVVLGVGLFGVAGWLSAAAALAPLERLRRTTEQVAVTTDLGTRVGGDPGPTEVKKLASSFDAMLERLEGADRSRQEALESARIFAAAAAHELRTPLTSLGANLEILSAHPDVGDREALMTDLVAEHRRLVELLEALRLLSRGDLTGPEAFEDLDLGDLVEQLVAGARRRFPEAEVSLGGPSGPVPVRGWGEGLRMSVDNLIVNAIRHGKSADGIARVLVAVTPADGGTDVVVSDRGPGIPVGDRQKVLERFVRGNTGAGPGSGLGLALVAQQARIHGGSLTIGDAAGGGAAVTLSLP